MSPAPTDDEERLAPGRIVAAIIFALFAIAFFAVAVIYATTPARQLPGFLGHARSGSHHELRAVGSFLVGLAFAVAGWFALRYRSLALEEAREADRAASAAAQAASSPAPGDGAGSLTGTGPMDATHS